MTKEEVCSFSGINTIYFSLCYSTYDIQHSMQNYQTKKQEKPIHNRGNQKIQFQNDRDVNLMREFKITIISINLAEKVDNMYEQMQDSAG